MAASEIYANVPLAHPNGSLRLLSIEPGWPSSPIQTRLIAVDNRKACPPYEALSYLWGNPENTQSITCNGVAIEVTVNLASALSALRELPAEGNPSEHGIAIIPFSDSLHSTRQVWRALAVNVNEEGVIEHRRAASRHGDARKLLWVDALCINQADKAECAAQVGTMRDIYTRAARVQIFLGREIGRPEDILTLSELAEPVTRMLDPSFPKLTPEEIGLVPMLLMLLVHGLCISDHEPTMLAGVSMPLGQGFLPFHSKEWKVLKAFLDLPWFGRVWIVQEAVLAEAATVILGDWNIDWESLCRGIQPFENVELLVPYNSSLSGPEFGAATQWEGYDGQPAAFFMKLRTEHKKELPLHEVLCATMDRKATNPRDHVYAILGMVKEIAAPIMPPWEPELLAVDYGKSVGEIFRDATRFVMLNERTLTFLADAYLTPSSHNLGCPSWVPNWAEPSSTCRFIRDLFNACDAQFDAETRKELLIHQYNHEQILRRLGEPATNAFSDAYSEACKDQPWVEPIEKNPDRNVLSVLGHWFDNITAATGALEGRWRQWHYPPTRKEIAFVNEAWDMVYPLLRRRTESNNGLSPDYYEAASIAAKALAYTLMANHECSGMDCRFRADRRMSDSLGFAQVWFAQHVKYFADFFSDSRKIQKRISHKRDMSFQHAIIRMCVGRRFFLTRRGFMGLGPASLQPGDRVAVVKSVPVPLVLRPVSSSESGKADAEANQARYVVVGECYVHGVMDGEFVSAQRGQGVEPQTICLV